MTIRTNLNDFKELKIVNVWPTSDRPEIEMRMTAWFVPVVEVYVNVHPVNWAKSIPVM